MPSVNWKAAYPQNWWPEHGISRTSLYKWKSKYSGMDVSQVKRLKELEEENRKLKQMYADLALDNQILRDVIEKKL